VEVITANSASHLALNPYCGKRQKWTLYHHSGHAQIKYSKSDPTDYGDVDYFLATYQAVDSKEKLQSYKTYLVPLQNNGIIPASYINDYPPVFSSVTVEDVYIYLKADITKYVNINILKFVQPDCNFAFTIHDGPNDQFPVFVSTSTQPDNIGNSTAFHVTIVVKRDLFCTIAGLDVQFLLVSHTTTFEQIDFSNKRVLLDHSLCSNQTSHVFFCGWLIQGTDDSHFQVSIFCNPRNFFKNNMYIPYPNGCS